MLRVRAFVVACVVTSGIAMGGCAHAERMGGDDEASASDAILGGTADEIHETAGLLTLPTQGFCGGTLVAPNVVATAAHCMKDVPSAFYLGKGVPITVFDPPSKALSTMKRYEVEDAVVFPAFDRARAFDGNADATNAYVCDEQTIDMALVKLRTKVEGLAPTPIGEAPAVGAPCEVVGFSTYRAPGATYETTHQRRMAQRRVQESPPFRIFSAALDGRTRRGDSGGGLFCAGKLVGVLACSSDSRDDHAGLDKLRGWIDLQIRTWAR